VNRTQWHNLSESAQVAATHWHVRLTSSDATEEEYEAFASWLAADAEHAVAYSCIETLSGQIEILARHDNTGLDHLIEDNKTPVAPPSAYTRSFPPRYAIAASLAVVFAVAAAFVGYNRLNPAIEQFAIAAPAAQFHTARLSDGSTIVLAPGAELKGEFSKSQRRIIYLSGVSFFDVESNLKRPFSIALAKQTITVVGTKFEIASFDNHQSVAVAEGVVAVSPVRAAKETGTRLSAGEQMLFSNTAPEGVRSTTPLMEIGVWRAGYFEFGDADVEMIAGKLNEFYGRPLYVVDQDTVSDVRFSGIITLSDPAGTAQRLSELMPLEAITTENGFLLTRAREAQE